MKEEHKKKIKKIIGEMYCPSNFKCLDSGSENLCKARDIGMESYLECLESNLRDCSFAFPFGQGYFCKCPLRVYLAKELPR